MQTLYPTLLAEFNRFKNQTMHQHYLLGFSGGLDSTVLLHLLAHDTACHSKTHARYVDHQIQPDSAQWAAHCAAVCKQWSISFEGVKVTLEVTTRQGIESRARKARYQALYKGLNANTILLTAHHQRDQVETFLLNLTRGSGVAGLASMPYQKKMILEAGEQTQHIRPLLRVPYQELIDYAEHYQLKWVEDPSNEDNHFARNQVRNQLLPEFEQACPIIQQQIERAISHQSEALGLITRLAENDLQHGRWNAYSILLSSYQILDWPSLKNVLRFWAKSVLSIQLSFDHLEWIKLHAIERPATSARLKLRTGSLRLYRGMLYYVNDFYVDYVFSFDQFERSTAHNKQPDKSFVMTADEKVFEFSLPKNWLQQQRSRLIIRPLKERDQIPLKKLKRWFQEHAIPDWQRPFWPVLCLDDVPFLVCGASLNKRALNLDKFQTEHAQLVRSIGEFEGVRYVFTEADVMVFFKGLVGPDIQP